jgi:RNA polymerase sigma-70 factor (ECF subfamily)
MTQDSPAPSSDTSHQSDLTRRLRNGDADAFREVVEAWTQGMLRVARGHVSTEASAEEVVQETWLAVIKGLDRFEGRSSLRTWVFRILVNLAKTRGVREARSVPWSHFDDDAGPTVDRGRFFGAGHEWAGHWSAEGAPVAWQPSPERSAIAREIREILTRELTLLPERQRIVVSLRDIEGMTSDEVCDVMDITTANQRVLLHRGRARLRQALEGYYREPGIEAAG